VNPIRLDPTDSTRREFCAHACQAASLLALGVFAGCGGGGSPTSPSSGSAPQLSSVSGSVSGRVVTVNIDSASPLATVGGAATTQTSLGTFLIARTGQDSFTALTAICTHEQCTVSGFASSRFVCPCHGSQYSTSGAVVQGPATRSLTSYSTQFANNVLTFSV
jgi:cytochrome b6-f complex iron-sulfur subunit